MWNTAGLDITPALPKDAGVYNCDGPPNALIDLALGRDVTNHSPGELGASTVELIEAAYASMNSGRLELVTPDRAR
jgi:hypothetical protein